MQELRTACVDKPILRYDNIDLLRMGAISLVVAYHYTARFPAEYLRAADLPDWFALGWLGVDLFFIVSAFCIYMSLDTSRDVVSFWAKRFARIQPAFVASIILTFAVISWFGLPGRETAAWVPIANAAWLNVFAGLPMVDGVYWSLIVELKFYFFIGLIFFYIGKQYLFYGWTAFAVAGSFLLHVNTALGDKILIGSYSPQFLVGLLAYEWKGLPSKQRWIRGALCLVLLLIQTRLASVMPQAIALLLFGFVVLQITSIRLPTWCTYIGLISYPLYLLHQNIGLVIIRELPFENIYLRVAIAIGMVSCLSAVLHHSVETRWKKSIERIIYIAAARAGKAMKLSRRRGA